MSRAAEHESVCPKRGWTLFVRAGRWCMSPLANQKIAGLIFPNPEWQRWVQQGIRCGNSSDPGKAGGNPLESSFFFIKRKDPIEWIFKYLKCCFFYSHVSKLYFFLSLSVPFTNTINNCVFHCLSQWWKINYYNYWKGENCFSGDH